MIVMIDNYDSFTYNLYQLIGEIYPDIKVFRNDEITVSEIEAMSPDGLIVSPGPGYPKDAGISVEAIQKLTGKMPILGVCLGHQSISEAFGGKIVKATELMHGKTSPAAIDTSSRLFKGLNDTIEVGRYHSLIVDENTLPDCLTVTAKDMGGQIMAIEHKEYPTFGVQFHPESILTKEGRIILNNFINIVKGVN